MEKPECNLGDLEGPDGNVFMIIGKVCTALKRAGLKDQADEFQTKAMRAGSYDEVLAMLDDYAEVI